MLRHAHGPRCGDRYEEPAIARSGWGGPGMLRLQNCRAQKSSARCRAAPCARRSPRTRRTARSLWLGDLRSHCQVHLRPRETRRASSARSDSSKKARHAVASCECPRHPRPVQPVHGVRQSALGSWRPRGLETTALAAWPRTAAAVVVGELIQRGPARSSACAMRSWGWANVDDGRCRPRLRVSACTQR